MRKLAGWLAILAMALNALWPLIAQARPATLVPVCTVGGVTHYIEIPGGTTPVDSQHEHCAFCFAGAALPATHVPQSVDACSFASPKATVSASLTFFLVDADARAPPVFPVVHFTNENDNGRTHEEAFTLPAADSYGSGGVLRVGILHG